MGDSGSASLEQRLAAVERVIEGLQRTHRSPADGVDRPDEAPADADPLWFVTELAHRMPGAVMMAGDMAVPDAGGVRWQYALAGEALLEHDWRSFASTIDALGHPARLTIIQLIMQGVRTTAELLDQDALGTTGQIHHHLRQLVAAGWLTSTRRGHYEVPAQRVIPLMVIIMAAIH